MRRTLGRLGTDRLPDVFYRYIFNGYEIEVTKIEKIIRYHNIVSFEYIKKNGTTAGLSHPETVVLGGYDGMRHAVFLTEPDKEVEAAMIFDQHLENRIASFEEKVKDCILKRKTLQQIMKGGSNGTSVQV